MLWLQATDYPSQLQRGRYDGALRLLLCVFYHMQEYTRRVDKCQHVNTIIYKSRFWSGGWFSSPQLFYLRPSRIICVQYLPVCSHQMAPDWGNELLWVTVVVLALFDLRNFYVGERLVVHSSLAIWNRWAALQPLWVWRRRRKIEGMSWGSWAERSPWQALQLPFDQWGCLWHI